MSKLQNNQSGTCQEDICYGCGNPIIEHLPNSGTWKHKMYEDCFGACRPKTQDNDRPMNYQADETAEEYAKRVKHYYDGVIP